MLRTTKGPGLGVVTEVAVAVPFVPSPPLLCGKLREVIPESVLILFLERKKMGGRGV